MTRFLWGLAARLKSCPSRAWRLPESLEGWGCGIPLFGFAQGRLLRKVRERWATPVCDGADRQQVPRLRKIIRLADDLSPLGMTRFLWGLAVRLTSCPSRSWRLPNPQRDGVVEFHPSASLRAGSFAKCAKDGAPWFVVVSAYSRFLDSARSSALRMIFLRSE